MSRTEIAILGAGPTGIEAALAAAERGRPFTLYEAADDVAASLKAWGHVRLFSPWSLDVSPRLRRRLTAAGIPLPDGDECPTGAELRQRALLPAVRLPDIAPNLRLGSRVVRIGREGLLKHEEIGTPERAGRPFRLLVRDAGGRERVERADIVLDCTGTWGHPNSLGDGGIPAPGERELEGEIVRTLPDLAADPAPWIGKRTLLVGGGHSAQTVAVGFAALVREHPGSSLLWALRREEPSWSVDPDDPLPARGRLTAAAAALAANGSAGVEVVKGVAIERLARRGEGVEVTLRTADGSERKEAVDRIVSLTGYVGDDSLYRQLQVHECYATSGPMKLSAALLGASSADCLDQEGHGAETLVNPEPGFFILGSKSYGRNAGFLMRVGWQQVEETMSLIAPAAAEVGA